jgi:hypothetical protein
MVNAPQNIEAITLSSKGLLLMVSSAPVLNWQSRVQQVEEPLQLRHYSLYLNI